MIQEFKNSNVSRFHGSRDHIGMPHGYRVTLIVRFCGGTVK